MHGAQTDWHIGLSFSMPFYNDSAKGLERQRSAIKWQSLFGIQRTSQYIAKVIRDIAYNQLSLYYKIKESDSIVKGNTIILSNEIKKLAAGNSSVYDVMNFEDAVLNSTLGSLYLYKEFQQNLATLRFFTNTLISSKNFGDEIEIENPRFLPVLP